MKKTSITTTPTAIEESTAAATWGELLANHSNEGGNEATVTATKALEARDLPTLWSLVVAHRADLGDSPHTAKAYRLGLEAWFRFMDSTDQLRALSLRKLNHYTAKAWVAELQHGGASVSTVRQRLAAVRALYQALVDLRVIGASPWGAVKATGRKATRREAYTDDQVRRLLATARAEKALDLVALVAVLRFLGLRIGEALGDPKNGRAGLQWEEVRPGSIVTVTGKGGKSRRAPIAGPVAEALEAWRKAGLKARTAGPVFPFTYAVALKRLGRLCRRAEVPTLGAHAFRHSFVTDAVTSGTLHEAQAWAGHADPGTTSGYLHHDATPAFEAFVKSKGTIADYLGGGPH